MACSHDTDPMMVCGTCGEWLGPRGKYAKVKFSLPQHFIQANRGGYTQAELVREHVEHARATGEEIGRRSW